MMPLVDANLAPRVATRLNEVGHEAVYVDVPPDQRPPGPPRYRIVYRLLPGEEDPRKVQIVAVGPRAEEIT